MHIVVITKSTPDTAAQVEVDASGNVTWVGAETVINPWDEYAIEEALLLKEAHGGSVTVVAVGPELDDKALRDAVAMGCDTPLRIWDESMEGADAFGLARAAAAAIAAMDGVNLVITGKEAVDTNTDALHLGAARALGWPALTFVAKIAEIDPGTGTIRVERQVEEGRQIVSTRLPAVLSVVKEINEPRYPSFIGIRKAAKLQIPVQAPGEVGAPQTIQTEICAPPAREEAVEIVEADTPEAAAFILADKLIEEGVI